MLSKSRLYNKLSSAGIILLFASIYIINAGIIELAIYTPQSSLAADGATTPLYNAIHNIELSEPEVSQLIAIILIIAGAIITMTTAIKHKLYEAPTHLPAIIYIGVFATLSTPNDLLAPPLVALLMMLSISNLYLSYGATNLSHKLFDGVFILGLLPLIYPAMILLVLLLPVILFLFERNGREIIVVIAAYITPSVISLYVGGLFGYDFGTQIELFREALLHFRGGLRDSLNSLILFACMLPSAIYVVRNVDELSIPLMSRKRTFFSVVVFIISLGMLFIPSFTPQQLLIAAAPISILSITAMAIMPDKWATRLYILYILIITAGRFIPI